LLLATPRANRTLYVVGRVPLSFYVVFTDTAPTEIHTLPLHDALPILGTASRRRPACRTAHATPGYPTSHLNGCSPDSAAMLHPWAVDRPAGPEHSSTAQEPCHTKPLNTHPVVYRHSVGMLLAYCTLEQCVPFAGRPLTRVPY